MESLEEEEEFILQQINDSNEIDQHPFLEDFTDSLEGNDHERYLVQVLRKIPFFMRKLTHIS